MRHPRAAALLVPLVLAVAACSGSATPVPAATAAAPAATSAPAAAGDTVTIANFSFQPATITVPVGTTVTWTNDDSASHTVTADDGSFTSESLGQGATFTRAFPAAGTFAYHCRIHPSMTAVVTVR
jgi:plastocyanin